MRMIFNNRKKAFSLTELLIVIVVVGVLFSAILPIMTKRRTSDINNRGKVWQFVTNDDQNDAYFDDGAAIIGRKPRLTDSWSEPYAKLYINANPLQDQIQFRYGEGEGFLTGLLYADPQGNLGLTSRLRCSGHTGQGACIDNYKAPYVGGGGNTFLGSGVAANNTYANVSTGSTIVGANASKGTLAHGMTVVGADSNPSGAIKYSGSGNNPAAGYSTVVGAQSAKSDTTFDSFNYIVDTIAVGDHILGSPNSQSENSVFLGSGTAAVNNLKMLHKNAVMVGSTYYGRGSCRESTGCRTARNNVLIGYDVMSAGPEGLNHTTAIGYGACDSVMIYGETGTWDGVNDPNNQTTFTCIGANSAINYGVNTDKDNPTTTGETSPHVVGETAAWERDGGEHIFIGGAPYNGLPGRAVLEVHNIPGSAPTASGVNPKMDSTVVLNSNLVVRGNLYFPSDNGVVSPHTSMNFFRYDDDNEVKYETGRDYCGTTCMHSKIVYTSGVYSDSDALFGYDHHSANWAASHDYRNVTHINQQEADWRSGFKCDGLSSALKTIGKVLFIAGAAVFAGLAIASGFGAVIAPGVILAAHSIGVAGFGGYVAGELMNNPTADDAAERPIDSRSASFMQQNTEYVCNPLGGPYSQLIGAASTSSKKGYCPNLKTSDIRLKENITENTDAIEKILLVQPYNYTFKRDLNKTPQTGVIAQDLQTYFPNSVTEGDDGYLKIRWDEMFFATINSVKSLDKTLTDIKNNIDNIDADIVVIGKSQKDIRSRVKTLDKQLRKLEEQNND